MAGDWIKMRHNLETDPDVLRIAEIVGVDRFSVVGRLHAIWTWADQHSIDGCAVRATTLFLDEMVCCANFCDALRTVGWLAGRDWDLQFPNFDRHNGESAKKRAQAQRTMQKRRSSSATNVAQNAQPEKRREEKSNKPPKSPTGESLSGSTTERFDPRSVALPPSLETDDFRSAWLAWCSHRSEIRKPLKPTMVEQQLAEFEALGAARSVRAIRHTIAKGWQGIREPEARGHSAVNEPARKPLADRKPLP